MLRPGGKLVVEFANSRSIARWGYGDLPVTLVAAPAIRHAALARGIRWDETIPGTHLPFAAWEATRGPVSLRAAVGGQRVCDAVLGASGPRSLVFVGTRIG